jgi:adenine deaminase
MLKIWRSLPILLAAFMATAGTQPLSATRAALAIRDVAVLTPTASGWLTHRDIIVLDTKITTIQPTGGQLPDAKYVIQGSGKFVIPGLFDNRVRLAQLWPDSAGLFIAHGVTSVSDTGTDAAQLAQWRRDLANGKVMGPRIMAATPIAGGGVLGSGAGEHPLLAGRSLQDELIGLVSSGRVTGAEALRRATIESARMQGREADLGSIEAGKNADLIVLDSDPLADIRRIREIDAVVFRGETLTRAHLNVLLSQAAAKGFDRR